MFVVGEAGDRPCCPALYETLMRGLSKGKGRGEWAGGDACGGGGGVCRDTMRLCMFFGQERTLDNLIPLLSTFFNDKVCRLDHKA